MVGLQDSAVADMTLRALGATPRAVPSSAELDGLDAYEQQLGSIFGNQYDSSAGHVTANLNLWPRPLVIVIDQEVFESLAPDQQSLLREAAVAAIPTALAAARAEDAEAAPVLCRRGLNFASASESDVAELRSALEPVYAELAKDPETKAAIDAIASAQVAGRCLCGDTRVPIGLDICVGRGIADRRQLRDHGHRADWVARGLEHGAYPVGMFTMIFDSGELTILEPNGQTGLEASYTVFRDQIEVEGGVDRFTARWALDGEQLTFTDIDVAGVEGGGEPYIVGMGVASLRSQYRGRRQSEGV